MLHRTTNWLEARSRWNALRALGQSNWVRASVLMPAFGYLLLLNENVHQYLKIEYDGAWLLHYLPSTWRIWLLFYGSFALAIGSILYGFFCPQEIKQYVSTFHLVGTERDHRSYHSNTDDLRNDVRALSARMSKWEQSLYPLPKIIEEANMGINSSDPIGGLLTQIWKAKDISRPRTRIAVYLLFCVGLGLIAVPAAITFVQVSLILLRHLM
jgi:hypothetical protein